jgi:hypothetical protein
MMYGRWVVADLSFCVLVFTCIKVILLSLSPFVLNALMHRCVCVQGHNDLFIVTNKKGEGCSYLEIAVTSQLQS